MHEMPVQPIQEDVTEIAQIEEKKSCPACGCSRVKLFHSSISDTVFGDCADCGMTIWQAIKK